MAAVPSRPGLRVALYWAPCLGDALHATGSAWLGRDAETGADIAQPRIPGLAAATASPRLYGLHATLRPPMRLATGWDEFMGAAEHLARSLAPFDLPSLALADLDGFLALKESTPCPALRHLADACLEATDRHRLPPSESELARRRLALLSPAQEALLQRWGYPYVKESWRFHVTLTGRLQAADRALLKAAAEAHFTGTLARPRRIDALCVLSQAVEGGPFLIAERLRFGGRGPFDEL